ncbi:MAG: heavy-metal-associated domain-containing protein [Candidatus Woesearchaeota archaeon]
MKNVSYNVKGMHCASCEMLIKDSLEEMDGVIKADVSHKKGYVKITFDEKKVKEDKIKEAIKKEGYEVI